MNEILPPVYNSEASLEMTRTPDQGRSLSPWQCVALKWKTIHALGAGPGKRAQRKQRSLSFNKSTEAKAGIIV